MNCEKRARCRFLKQVIGVSKGIISDKTMFAAWRLLDAAKILGSVEGYGVTPPVGVILSTIEEARAELDKAEKLARLARQSEIAVISRKRELATIKEEIGGISL